MQVPGGIKLGRGVQRELLSDIAVRCECRYVVSMANHAKPATACEVL